MTRISTFLRTQSRWSTASSFPIQSNSSQDSHKGSLPFVPLGTDLQNKLLLNQLARRELAQITQQSLSFYPFQKGGGTEVIWSYVSRTKNRISAAPVSDSMGVAWSRSKYYSQWWKHHTANKANCTEEIPAGRYYCQNVCTMNKATPEWLSHPQCQVSPVFWIPFTQFCSQTHHLKSCWVTSSLWWWWWCHLDNYTAARTGKLCWKPTWLTHGTASAFGLLIQKSVLHSPDSFKETSQFEDY